MINIASLPLNLSRLSCNGVFLSFAAFMSPAILPSSVYTPVVVLIAVAIAVIPPLCGLGAFSECLQAFQCNGGMRQLLDPQKFHR